MPKKNLKKTIKNKLDKLWADIIKKRAHYRCEICGSQNNLNSHHIEGRSPMILRWDTDNGVCLCVAHHTFGHVSAHSTSYSGQKQFHRLLEDLKGKKLLNRLKRTSKKIVNYSLNDLKKLYQDLNKEFKALK